MLPKRIARSAPVAIALCGLALLGAAAGGVASLDDTLVAATAEQRQVRMVDYQVEREAWCPEPGAPGPEAVDVSDDRWRS